MKNKVELLAPAGDLERLKIALLYGADAVYIGGPLLNLRANAINFTFDEIKEATTFAHNLNKKVYVTVNIVLHNEELKELENYLKKLEECKVDAIIVSDPAVIKEALTKTNLEVHLSTQASTLNKEAVKFWKEQGLSRIVLGRECSREEIKEIIDNVDIEIETFIHGAMCAGYSGRCVMSNFLTNRDANRGGCSQICRWDFDLLNENKEEIKGDMPFTFCSKDLSMLKHIPEMIDMGIASFNSALRSCLEYQVRQSYEGYSEDAIEDAVKTVDRAYLILTSHYQDGKTLTQLGKELGISTSRVGQLMHMNERRIKLFKFRIEERSRVPENLKVLARHLLLFTKPYE
jgi:collagenase-like PrtC family protease